MKAQLDDKTIAEPAPRMIEAANSADIDALNILLNQCASAMASQGMRHWLGVYDKQSVTTNVQQKTVFTLRDKQRIVACVALASAPAGYYADCWPEAPKADCYLTMLAVSPDYQQQGLGKLMVQYCQRQIPAGQTLQLDAVAHYPALLDFYRQLGFQQIADGIGLGDKRYLFSWSAK
ncbi:MAG TPA: GNAT family N-acetyltransferase [Methylophaga sp.]|nr:GNAT family N-acetyltransferase [Methylophaga sp.]